MQADFIQWLVGQAGVAGLAGLALWMLKASYEDRLSERQDERRRQERLLTRVTDALDKNTRVLSYLLERTTEVDSPTRRDLE